MGYIARENGMLLHSFDQKSKDEKARAGGYTGPVTQNRRSPGVPIFPSQVDDLRDRLGTGTAALVDRSSVPNASMADIEALLDKRQSTGMDAINSRLSELSRSIGTGAAAPVVNDSRQDNRSYPVTVQAPVNVTVQQASDAPRAIGNAISGAISKAAQTPARIAAEPASTGWGGPR